MHCKSATTDGLEALTLSNLPRGGRCFHETDSFSTDWADCPGSGVDDDQGDVPVVMARGRRGNQQRRADRATNATANE